MRAQRVPLVLVRLRVAPPSLHRPRPRFSPCSHSLGLQPEGVRLWARRLCAKRHRHSPPMTSRKNGKSLHKCTKGIALGFAGRDALQGMLPPCLRLATVVLLVALACFPGLVLRRSAPRWRSPSTTSHKLGPAAVGPQPSEGVCTATIESISCSWFFYRLLPAAAEGPSVPPGALLPP